MHIHHIKSGWMVITFNFLCFSENREKALLYMILGICVGVIIFLLVIIIRLVIINKQKRRATLDVTDPAHSNTQPPPLDNSAESPMLPRSDSIDRIEVVRFEPRRTIARASLIDNGDRTLNHYYGWQRLICNSYLFILAWIVKGCYYKVLTVVL